MARFGKRVRLLRPLDFTAVFDQGFRLPGRLLDARVRVATDGHARLGLAISSRSLALATRRNRLKRLVRESFRHHAHALPPVDVVVSARREIATGADQAVREELQQLWARIAERCRTS
jgi:ribonuclease P protein component